MFSFKSTSWYLRPLLYILLCIALHSIECNAFTTAPKENQQQPTYVATKTKNNNEQIDFLQLEEFKKFITAYQLIKKYYVFEVADKTLIDNAIKGMVDGLDPHSMYLDEKAIKNLDDFSNGNFAGIGIEVIFEEGLAKIISTLDDTPASKAGIKNGDIIISINGSRLIKKHNEILAQISGKPNTLVNLAVFRPSEKKEFSFSLKRQTIKLQSVNYINTTDGISYIKIKIFNGGTSKEFHKKLEHLIKEYANNTIKGIILDLRNNPGGIIASAVDICGYFMQKSLIVYTQDKEKQSKQEYYSKKMPISLYNVPMVIIINDGSASCSEIIAGAFQDYKRAIVIGTKSFGKGSVQRIATLKEDNSAGIKLTTDLYYTPKGRAIQFMGVTPDIEIPPAIVTLKPNNTFSEKDLYNNNNSTKKTTDNIVKNSTEVEKLLSDYQVNQALQILKGMLFRGCS